MIELLPSGRAAASARDVTAAQYAALAATPGQYYSEKNRCFTFDPTPLACHSLKESGLDLAEPLRKESDRWSRFIDYKTAPRPVVPRDTSASLKTQPWAHQAEGIDFALNCPSPYLNMGMGTGKAQPLDAEILTPDGFIAMRDVRPGRLICSPDGGVSKVVGVHPQGIKEVFRVFFSDGTSTECCDDHLWDVHTAKQKNRGTGCHQILPLSEIRSRGLYSASGNCRWYIPITKPVLFVKQVQPIDPYVLGVLLGDGCIKFASVQVSCPDDEIIDIVAGLIPSGMTVKKLSGECSYSIKKAGGKLNAIIQPLRDLGLHGKGSQDKFIPDKYLLGDQDQRLSVLQGLMDTDGSVESSYGATITLTSKKMCEGILFIVQSLGGVASLRPKNMDAARDSGRFKSVSPAWRLHIRMPHGVNPFRMKRKADSYRPAGKYGPVRAIVSVVGIEKKECQCITVDHPSRLYMTNDCIVTHNSLVTIGTVAGAGHRRTLILCPKAVVDVWPKQFRIHSHDEAHNVVALPDVTTKKKVEVARRALSSGHPSTVIVTNYEAAIQKDLHEWLKTIKWDSVVCDEIHKIKACSGKASRMAHSLSTGHPIGLSGTMLPHDPLDAWSQFRFLEPAIFGTSFMRFKHRYAFLGKFNEPLRWLNLDELSEKIALITYKVAADVLSLPGVTHQEMRFRLSPKTMKFYRKFFTDLVAEYGDGVLAADNVLVKSLRLQQLTSGFFTDDQTGELIDLDDNAKLGAFEEWLSSIPQEEPIVVFAKFKKDIDNIQRILIKAGRSYGELSSRANDLVESAYPPHLNAMAVNIASGGVGIDLTRAAYACYFSITYNGGDFEQSIARLHRPGQTRKVHITHLVAEDTIDPDIYDALAENRDLANLVLNAVKKGGPR